MEIGADDAPPASRPRAPPCRSGRAGSRPRTRRGRCRCAPAPRRRSGARSPCSRPAAAPAPARRSSARTSAGSSPWPAGSSPNGREPVERDAAADGVEARLGEAERAGAVRQVRGHAGEGVDDLAEAVDLLAGERLVGLVGGGEMAHHPDDALARHGQRLLRASCPSGPCRCRPSGGRRARRAPPGTRAPPRAERRAPTASSPGASGPMTRMRADGNASRSSSPSRDGRHAERRGSALERGARGADRPVPVAVRLHDGPELRRRRRLAQARGVPPDRAEVDRDLASASPLTPRGRARGPRSTSRAIIPACP